MPQDSLKPMVVEEDGESPKKRHSALSNCLRVPGNQRSGSHKEWTDIC
jgi:hypothetical protein